MQITAELLIRRIEKAFNNPERKNAEETWSLLSEFILPNQSGIFYTNSEPRGEKKTQRLYDSTAPQANHDLASSLHSSITNQSIQWAELEFEQDELNDDNEASAWLEQVTKILHKAYRNSNLYTELLKSYTFLSCFATAPLFIDSIRDKNKEWQKFKFRALHLANVCIEENEHGEIDTAYIRSKMTARNAVAMFGDKVSDRIKETVEREPEKQFTFYQCVMPRHEKEIDRNSPNPKKKPFANIYVEKDGQKIVYENGFDEFRIPTPRWDVMPFEVYGRGPGHIALPDIRTLNTADKLMLQSIAKNINPPTIASSKNIIGTFDQRPGSLSIVQDIQGIQQMVPQSRFDVTQLFLQERRDRIKAAFFLDKLLLPPRQETGEMTAFEVATRTEQIQRVLGPTFGRLESELLSPLVSITFNIMMREGQFPELPAVLEKAKQEGKDGLNVRYVNPLARSQRIEEFQALQQWLQFLGGTAQLLQDMSPLDNFNYDQAAEISADVLGVPQKARNSDTNINRSRQQRQQQMQQQQAMQTGVDAADIAAKLGKQGGGNV